MSLVLLQHKGRFNYFNSYSMRFEFDSSLDREELRQVVEEREGEQGLRNLPQKINKSGGLSRLDDVLFCNRAGENGKHLTLEECIEIFLS